MNLSQVCFFLFFSRLWSWTEGKLPYNFPGLAGSFLVPMSDVGFKQGALLLLPRSYRLVGQLPCPRLWIKTPAQAPSLGPMPTSLILSLAAYLEPHISLFPPSFKKYPRIREGGPFLWPLSVTVSQYALCVTSITSGSVDPVLSVLTTLMNTVFMFVSRFVLGRELYNQLLWKLQAVPSGRQGRCCSSQFVRSSEN